MMLMKRAGRRWIHRAHRAGAGGAGRCIGVGKDIGEYRFRGAAGGKLSTDRRGEGGAAWSRLAGRVRAGHGMCPAHSHSVAARRRQSSRNALLRGRGGPCQITGSGEVEA
jgi:hypothetical protein